MTILEAIINLLQFQETCTIAQIASIAGKKQGDVLLCINKNSQLLKTDRKGKITGFVDTVRQMRAIAYQNGQSYTESTINYGCQQVYETKNPAASILNERYYCGGLGDSYAVQAILKTEENRIALEKLGIRPYNGVIVKTPNELWKE